MLVWIVGLAICLLSCYLTWWSAIHLSIRTRCTTILVIWIDCVTIIESLFFLFGTFFEEHFSQDIFFLLMRVIILHVVVMRLIENAVRIVIAVWIFISYSSRLTYRIRINSTYNIAWAATIYWILSILTVRALASDQEYSLVETTYDWYLGWLLRWLSWLLLIGICRDLWLLLTLLTLTLTLITGISLCRRSLRWLHLCVLILGWSYIFLFWCLIYLRRLHTFLSILCWTCQHVLMLRDVIRAGSLLEDYLSTCTVRQIALLWIRRTW